MAVTKKTARQKKLEGNPGKRRVAEPVALPQGEMGDPEELGPIGRAQLARLQPLYEEKGRWVPSCKARAEDHARVFERMIQLEQRIQEDGPTIDGRNRGGGIVKHPLYSELKAYRAFFQKYEEMLERIDGTPPDDEDDEDEAFNPPTVKDY